MEFTGKEGKVSLANGTNTITLDVTGWSATVSAAEHRTDDTGTAGYSDRITGIRDCKFTVDVNIDAATNLFDTPNVAPGQTITDVKLYYQGSTGACISIPIAKVLETPITSKVDDLTKMTINCANKGAFVLPTGTFTANVP